MTMHPTERAPGVSDRDSGCGYPEIVRTNICRILSDFSPIDFVCEIASGWTQWSMPKKTSSTLLPSSSACLELKWNVGGELLNVKRCLQVARGPLLAIATRTTLRFSP
jgi:hypothetical protein